ncbi:MAG: metallophosphoesterase family protein [Candidatus Omnitrophica bacterium]|nr:metallophosphoesterase family protein [Candidatus Omnitrophota bacterium]MCB9747784.1 metallophosphoesterase family protein [Candidatus Omnitrophota bacterium]
MKYGIISDIHSNLEAMRAVLQALQKSGVDALLCLGDIVGYNADAKKCLDIVRDLNPVCVVGNHDLAVAGKLDPSHFTENGRQGVVFSRNQLEFSDIEYIKQLPLKYHHRDFELVHGSLNQPERFIYLNDITKSQDTFYLMKSKVCFVGHTHKPQIYVNQGKTAAIAATLNLSLETDARYIVNTGSVGQPRDGDPRASFCVYDTDEETIEIKRVEYDVKTAQQKILQAGLPEKLALRLAVGS